MELHTLGVDGGYDQTDVEALALILTGWTVGNRRVGAPVERIGTGYFSDRLHEPGSKRLLGRRFADDGPDQALDALRFLASRPQTARHLCTKLARHFFSDTPHPAQIDHLERAWRASQGDLAEVAAALTTAPGAFSPEPEKFTLPEEFLIKAMRALELPSLSPPALATSLNALGQTPFTAPAPTGWSDEEADWAGPDAILKRLDFASSLAERAGGRVDPRALARSALGPRLSADAAQAVARAETPEQGLTLLLMSPDFQRR